MSNFKGKNNFQVLGDQFIDKNNFFIDGHIQKGPEVFDFDYIEYQMYGTIDLEGASIAPKQSKLVRFNENQDENETHLAFDFVVNMFNDVKINVEMAGFLGELVVKNEFLSKMQVKRAYESPKDQYKTSFANILIQFNNILEGNRVALSNITSFPQYVKEFLQFLKNYYVNYPITFSAWLQSGLNSIFTTGLAVSIADIPFDDDDKKYDDFMSSLAFNHFKRICLNRGFRVHQHIPYILVADLMSPAIKPYLTTDITTTLSDYFYRSNIEDYIIIKNYIITYYNILVERNPFVISIEPCTSTFRELPPNIQSYGFDGTTLKKAKPRLQPTPMGEQYWLNYYLDIRNIELGMLMKPAQINKIRRYLKNMKNYLDKFEKISYIDSNFQLQSFNKSNVERFINFHKI